MKKDKAGARQEQMGVKRGRERESVCIENGMFGAGKGERGWRREEEKGAWCSRHGAVLCDFGQVGGKLLR